MFIRTNMTLADREKREQEGSHAKDYINELSRESEEEARYIKFEKTISEEKGTLGLERTLIKGQ